MFPAAGTLSYKNILSHTVTLAFHYEDTFFFSVYWWIWLLFCFKSVAHRHQTLGSLSVVTHCSHVGIAKLIQYYKFAMFNCFEMAAVRNVERFS